VTAEERAALVAYLDEQRRHMIAQVKACERLLAALKGEPCYNKTNLDTTETVSVSIPPR